MSNKKSKLEKSVDTSVQKHQQQEYQKMVKVLAPSPPVLKNALAAFFVGGFICAFSQVFLILFEQMGINHKDAGAINVVLMIFIGALLTGLGIYDNLGKFAGAGSLIPITGFANSIVSSAMEWKREGYIFGVAAKMFTIAGPVLVYGILSSVIIGLIYILI